MEFCNSEKSHWKLLLPRSAVQMLVQPRYSMSLILLCYFFLFWFLFFWSFYLCHTSWQAEVFSVPCTFFLENKWMFEPRKDDAKWNEKGRRRWKSRLLSFPTKPLIMLKSAMLGKSMMVMDLPCAANSIYNPYVVITNFGHNAPFICNAVRFAGQSVTRLLRENSGICPDSPWGLFVGWVFFERPVVLSCSCGEGTKEVSLQTFEKFRHNLVPGKKANWESPSRKIRSAVPHGLLFSFPKFGNNTLLFLLKNALRGRCGSKNQKFFLKKTQLKYKN